MTQAVEGHSGGLLDFSADGRTIRKSAFDSVLIQLLFRLKGIITMPVMTYYLTPDKLGIFNLILLTSALLVPLFSLNLTDGPAIHFVQERSRERIVAMYNTVTNSVILFSLLLYPLLWLVMYLIGGEYYGYLPLMALLLCSNLFYKVVTYVLAVFQKTSFLVKNTVMKDGAATLLTIGVVAAGYSYQGMVAVLVITNLISGLLVYRYTRRELIYGFAIDKEILRRFLKTSLPLMPVFIFSWIVQSSDSYFLAYFQGQESVGKYSVIYGLASVILSLTFALNFFWFPVSARLWMDDREKYRKGFTLLFAAFTTLLFTAVTLFELDSQLIMDILVRRAEYQEAHVIMGIIAFAFAMQVLITLLTAPLYSNGNTRSIFTAYLCGGIVNTIMNIAMIPSSGIMGAAISTAVSYLLIMLIMAWMNYRMAGFPFFDRRLLPVTAVFAIAWGGVTLIRDSLQISQLLMANVILICGVSALIYAWMLRPEEKAYLAGIYNEFRLRFGRS